ncbi:MAG: universal stress protein [Bacteroidia bacterium]
MMKILVPTDFSKNAENAIKYAVAFAKKEKSKIILFHAYHEILNVSKVQEYAYANLSGKLEKESDDKLKNIYTKIIKPANIECECLSQYQLAVDAILEIIKDKKIDFVIMGTKGATGITAALLGSISAKIIEKAPCPVIAVPENARFEPIKKITFATDYNNADIQELKTLVNIATPFKAQINLLHIADGEYTGPEEEALLKKYVKKITSKIDYKNLSFQLLESKDIEKKLEQYVNQKSTSVLAISTKKKGLFEKLFGTSITKKLAYHSTIPLIAFHHKSESVVFI